jgi:hypothetical protein
MKALTLTQPWASLVIAGVKRFETRGWRPPTTGRVAIHAGKGWTGLDRAFAADLHRRGLLPDPDALPLGAVIGEATIVDYLATGSGGARMLPALERELGDYTPGRWAWELVDVVAYPEPIPARGMLGLWEWERPR